MCCLLILLDLAFTGVLPELKIFVYRLLLYINGISWDLVVAAAVVTGYRHRGNVTQLEELPTSPLRLNCRVLRRVGAIYSFIS